MAGSPSTTLCLSLELDCCAQPLAGRIRFPDGGEETFHGWTSMVGLLDDLVTRTATATEIATEESL